MAPETEKIIEEFTYRLKEETSCLTCMRMLAPGELCTVRRVKPLPQSESESIVVICGLCYRMKGPPRDLTPKGIQR